MGQDPFSFDVQLATGTDGQSESPRYIAPPFDARMVSTQEVMLLPGHEQHILKLPMPSARALGACDRFRTIDEHTRHAAGAMRLAPEQIPALRQSLQHMADQGVLRTEQSVFHMLTDQINESAPETGIETLFVRTCARPDTLQRLIDSIVAMEDTGGLKRCVVLDDDPDADSSELTAQLVKRNRSSLPIDLIHVSRRQRGRILAGIARAARVQPEHLAWCIDGNAGDDRPGYGASLNLALLLGAGERIAMIDDDAALSAFHLDSCGNAVRFSAVHAARLAFPDPDLPLTGQFEPLAGNPLDHHAACLGASGGELARAGENDLTGMFGELDPHLLFDLARRPRVRITSNGTLGDPGTSGIQWLLAEPADNLKPLCESETRYRALLEQRQVARSPDGIRATTTFRLMTTTLSGIDNRQLLLPTQARGANEDLLFGALVSYLYPGSLHVALPHMLLHMRPVPRRWQAEDFGRARTTNQGRFLASAIERLSEQVPAADTASRIRFLEGWMNNLASLDQQELGWRLRQDLISLRGDTIENIAERRRELNPPPWLAADFDRSLAAHAEITDQTSRKLDRLANQLPVFAGHFAGSLGSWCQAWQYCCNAILTDLLETSQQDTVA